MRGVVAHNLACRIAVHYLHLCGVACDLQQCLGRRAPQLCNARAVRRSARQTPGLSYCRMPHSPSSYPPLLALSFSFRPLFPHLCCAHSRCSETQSFCHAFRTCDCGLDIPAVFSYVFGAGVVLLQTGFYFSTQVKYFAPLIDILVSEVPFHSQ